MTIGRNLLVQFNEYAVRSPMLIIAQVTKDAKSGIADSAQIQIYNLSRGTMADIIDDNTKVQLYGGYGEQENLIFTGNLQFITSTKSETEWITTVIAGDGDNVMRQNLLNKTYTSGVKLDTIVRDAANALVGDPELLDVRFQHQPGRGITISGKAHDTLEKYAKNANATVNIQDGKVVVAGPKAKRSVIGYKINISTGMVGVPVWMNIGQDNQQLKTLKGRRIRVDSLCIPSIKPFDKVHIKSDALMFKEGNKTVTVDHVFTVDRVDHNLNSRESDFMTSIEAIFHDG